MQKTVIQLEDAGIFSIQRLKDSLEPKQKVQTRKEFSNTLIAQMLLAKENR